MKKVLSIFMSLVMLLSITAGIDFKAYAGNDVADIATVDYSDLTVNQYISKILVNKNYMGVGSDYNTSQKVPESEQFDHWRDPNNVSFSRILVNGLQENKDFMDSVGAWELLTFDGTAADKTFKQEDYYSTILFNILNAKVEDNEFIKDLNCTTNKTILSLSKSTSDFLKEITNVDVSDLNKVNVSDFTDEQFSELMESIGKANETKDLYESVGKNIGVIKDSVKLCTSVADIVKTVSLYSALNETSQSTQNVLKSLIDNCPDDNLPMKAACNNVYKYTTGALSDEMIAMMEGGKDIVTFGIDKLANNLWKSTLTTALGSFGTGAIIGQAVGRSISNFAFSTDATIDKYYSMKAMVEFEDLLSDTVSQLCNKFDQNETPENSDNLLRSIEMILSTYDLGYDYTKDFAEITFEKGFVNSLKNLSGENKTYADIKENVEQMKLFVKNAFGLVSIDTFKNYLKLDAPSLYKLLYGDEFETDVPITELKVTQTAPIKVGDSGLIYDYFSFVFGPENSTEVGKIESVTSSDKNVIRVSSIGITALNPGKCFLTFTCNNSVTSTIEVDVNFEGYSIGDLVTFGSYPKTLVKDENLINKLNSLNLEWKSYEYYSGTGSFSTVTSDIYNNIEKNNEHDKYFTMSKKDYMKYADVEFGGDKYRAVYFTEYRPVATYQTTAKNNSNQPGNNYFINKVYWFKYEPLHWYLLDETGLAICEEVIDAQPYHNEIIRVKSFGISTPTSYANSYKHSNLDLFVDETFYNTAFDSIDKSYLQNFKTDILNDEYTPLLKNASIGYSAFSTDYSKAQGGGSSWWIYNNKVGYYAKLQYYDSSGNLQSFGVDNPISCNTSIGVRPVVYLTKNYLKSFKYNNIRYVCNDDNTCYVEKTCNYDINKADIPNNIYGYKVTSIERGAFYGCENLTNATIGNSVTSIGNSAFYGCKSLTSVTIPDSVTSIGDYAFKNCTSLTSVTISDSVTSIDWYAFENCTSLTDIYYNGSKSQWNSLNINLNRLNNAIIHCTDGGIFGRRNASINGLKYQLNDDNTAFLIGYDAAPINLDIPDTLSYAEETLKVTRVLSCAFENCTGLKSVIIPDSITIIGSDAFRNCASLTSVTIPISVTNIDSEAFEKCENITDVYYLGTEEQWKAIDIAPFNDYLKCAVVHCTDGVTFEYKKTVQDNIKYCLVSKNNAYVSGYDGESTSVKIPNKITYGGIDVPVTSIGNGAFSGSTSLASVKIPNSVTSIGERAFSGCTSLISITIPNNVTSIGNFAFYNCTNLTSVTIPDSITIINDSVFNNCTSLTDVYYNGTKAQWKSISVGNNNDVLKNVTLHFNDGIIFNNKAVTQNGANYVLVDESNAYVSGYENSPKSLTIDKVSFAGVEVPVTSIKDSAFRECYSLEDITLGDSITNIGDYAFFHCTSLKSITIPDGVTSIGDCTFYWSGLNKITIPDSVTRIDASAFLYCSIKDVYYTGTQSQWSKIAIESGNESLNRATIHYNFAPCKGDNHNSFGEWVIVKAATCTEAGLKQRTCSNDGYVEEKVIPATGHTEKLINVKEPTCSSEGYTGDKVCTVCNEVLEKGQETAKISHTYTSNVVAPTCTAQGYTKYTCTVCGDTYTDSFVDALGHTEVVDEAVAATCTKSGLTEGKHCSTCNAVLVKQEIVDALGHKAETVPGKAATCTEKGLTAGSKCSVCSEILKKQETIPALGHKEKIVNNKDATCTKDGYTGDEICTICNEVLEKGEVIPMFGHSYVSSVVAPTCTEQGYTKYTCTVCGDTYTDSFVNALGHTEKLINVKEPTCTSTGYTGDKVCTVCNKVLEKGQEIPMTEHIYEATSVEPTCTEQGHTLYKCENCDYSYKVYDGEPATGHKEITDEAVEPTCTKTGLTEGSHCAVCKEVIVKQEVIPAKGHTIETVSGRPATCTEKGLTEGKKCTVCGEVLEAQVEIPAKGHTVKVINKKDATYTENGYTGDKVCSVCNEVLEVGHETEKLLPTTQPTTTTQPSTSETTTTTTVVPTESTTSAATQSTAEAPTTQPTTVPATTTAPVVTTTQPAIVATTQATTQATTEATTTTAAVPTTTAQTVVATTQKPTTTKAPEKISKKQKNTKVKKATPAKASATISWAKVKGVKGYEVQLATDKKFKKNVKSKTINKQKTTKTTVKNLKAKTKYYVRIRTYKMSKGTKVYSTWSKTKTVKTKGSLSNVGVTK